jgi:hypothetical protein
MPLVRDYVGGDGGGAGGDWGQWITYATTTNNTSYILRWNGNETASIALNDYWGWTTSSTTIGNYCYPATYGTRLMYVEPDEMQQVFTEIEVVADEVARQERLQARARASEANRLLEERNQSRAVAIARGEELLLSLLDENQREAYRFDRMFSVIGSHGTIYRIHRGVSGNIEWIKPDGTVGGRLCAHPTMREEWIPTEDVMLAQLLALTHDEREFVRVANVHTGQRPPIGVAA